MPNQPLTARELNRATLARQLLLERAALQASDALRRLGGLQAQVSNPPYIALWSRLQTFQREDLDRLIEHRQVVRATMMRSTLHLMFANDYMLLRPALQPALTRALHAFFAKQAKGLDVTPFVEVAREYVQKQPRTFVEIRARLLEAFPDIDPALMAYIVRTHLPLVQIPPGGEWNFTGSPAHTLAEAWIEQPFAGREESLRFLILRYLAAFGPASVKDIQTWSGLSKLKGILDTMRPELCVFRDEQSTELFDLSDMPLPAANVSTPPRFLPEFDNILLAYADRNRIIPEQYRSSVFLTVGRVRATFLVDGFVAGTWKIECVKGAARLIIEPFEQLAEPIRADLLAEGERLIHFIENDAESFQVQFT